MESFGLALEPHSRPCVSKRGPIQEFSVDGTAVYKTRETANDRLGRKIGILFDAGLFQDVTTEQLEAEAAREAVKVNVPEEQDLAQDVVANTVCSAVGDGAAPPGSTLKGKQLSFEEMARLKAEMDARLTNAYYEINAMQELCQSLLPGSAPPFPAQPFPYIREAGTIPLESLTMVAASEVTTYRIRSIQESKMAIARNRKGLVECRRALEEGSKRLKTEVGRASKGYWSVMGSLAGLIPDSEDQDQIQDKISDDEDSEKDDQVSAALQALNWAILPRPLANGVPEGKQLARDVMIPYAADEAATHIRRRAIAFVNPKGSAELLDDHELPFLFPGRRYRRLRVILKTTDGDSRSRLDDVEVHSDDTSSDDAAPAEVSQSLEIAQAEVFDEEIYEGLVRESRSKNAWDAAVTMDRIVLKPVVGVELVFEMINPDDEEDAKSLAPLPSGRADLLLAMVRLRLLEIYRSSTAGPTGIPEPPLQQVKGQAVAQTAAESAQRELLPSVIAYIRYQAFIDQIMVILGKCQEAARSLGLELAIEREDGLVAGGIRWSELISGGAERTDEAGPSTAASGSIDVVLDGRQILSLVAFTACRLTLVFPHITLVSQDIAQLPSFLVPELQKGVLRCLRDALATAAAVEEGVGETQRKVIVDESKNAITTKDVKLQVSSDVDDMHFNVTAYRIIRDVEAKLAGRVETLRYDSDESKSVVMWARSLIE